MIRRPIRFAAALAAAAVVSSAALFFHTQAQTPAPAPAAKSASAPESITVYCDVNMLGRKNTAAEKLTKLHAQKATEGYTFANLQTYTENGDIQGFFVTYTRVNG